MARPDLNQLWALANEDGNPELTVIDLTSGNQKTYPATVNPTAHGGGFDDMQLINGVVYMSASNPTTPGAAAPTVVTLTPNDKTNTFDVAPVLAGDATALDITPSNSTYNQPVTLALSDPDSEETTTDSSGKPVLVLDSQADGKLVFIHNPGSAQQTVSVLSLTLYDVADGPMEIVDDTRFVPADPDTFMLFCDGYGTVYRLNGHFKSGDAYSNGQDMVMKLDKTTGIETPVVAAIGVAALHDPHGMLFFNDEN